MSALDRVKLAYRLALLSLAGCACLTAQQQRFSGSVRAGQPFVRAIAPGLVLVVSTAGIQVQAAPYSPDGENFAQCVTPPAHGPNPIDLSPWLFDPAQNSDPHPRHRVFQFTLNAADNKSACEGQTALVYTLQPGGLRSPTKTSGYRPPPQGQGILDITKLRLSRPAGDFDAQIESFDFVATITLPTLQKAAVQPRQP